jgi:hypothetical protein
MLFILGFGWDQKKKFFKMEDFTKYENIKSGFHCKKLTIFKPNCMGKPFFFPCVMLSQKWF